MHKIGIVGYTGMVGQEIQKVLSNHDKVKIVYTKNSTGEQGNMNDCELIFLATKDEESMNFSNIALKAGIKVIDMSGAYRLPLEYFEKWYNMKHIFPWHIEKAVYGMPAFNFDKIKDSVLTANPGCYPTSVILPLRPLVGLLKKDNVCIVSTSGVSGARRVCDEISDDVAYSYGKKHKHVPEMQIYSGFDVDFTPIIIKSVFKGINTNIRADLADDLKNMPDDETRLKIESTLKNAYCGDDRVFVVNDSVEKMYGTNDVNGTHDIIIKVRVDNGKVYINAVLDNLMKGAASQGVENMNIMLGLDRLEGIENA